MHAVGQFAVAVAQFFYDEVDMALMSLFDTVLADDIIKELSELDISNMTPMDALNTLYRFQGKVKNRWK